DSDHPWHRKGEIRGKTYWRWLGGIHGVIARGADDNGTQPATTTDGSTLDRIGNSIARTRVTPTIVDHIGVCGAPCPVDGICDVRLGVFQVVAENACDNEVDVRRDTTDSLSIVLSRRQYSSDCGAVRVACLILRRIKACQTGMVSVLPRVAKSVVSANERGSQFGVRLLNT